jgi:excinuclease ABC subunit C
VLSKLTKKPKPIKPYSEPAMTLDSVIPAYDNINNNQATPFDLAHFLENLPSTPGVYRHIDKQDTVLYVGKAKNLKNRVNSYFAKQLPSSRIALMVAKIVRIEITVTRSEAEALLLENNLIKALNPRYNIVFRDDKSYPLLRFTLHQFPRMTYYRGVLDKKANYFGPYPSGWAVKETIILLQKIFLLRNCTDSFFAHRTRACLQHQIGRCSAPCVGLIDTENYRLDVNNAMRFLQGKTQDVLDELANKMNRYAQDYAFEQAAVIRDQMAALSKLQHQQVMDNQGKQNVDIIALIKVSGLVVLNLAMVRDGKHLGDRPYRPAHAEQASLSEVLEAFITHHYDGTGLTMPSVLIINLGIESEQVINKIEIKNNNNLLINDTINDITNDTVNDTINDTTINNKNVKNSGNNNYLTVHNKLLLQSLLSERAGHSVIILQKPQGARRLWLEQAVRNAEMAAARFLSEKNILFNRLKQLAILLNLNSSIKLNIGKKDIQKDVQEDIQEDITNIRIECFDISHTSGEATQGSCVVFEKISLQVKQYKRFNIINIKSGDDYAAMNQVLMRYYGRIAAMEIPRLPDIVLIDGGIGQVAIAKAVFIALGLSTQLHRIVGISKGEGRKVGLETLIFADGRLPLNLPHDSPALMLLALIRDEAHRFAITGMRSKRAKTRNTSSLEHIEGIGPKRRKALLSRFGGISGVEQATCEDLATVDGISDTLAKKIYIQLNGQ